MKEAVPTTWRILKAKINSINDSKIEKWEQTKKQSFFFKWNYGNKTNGKENLF